MATMITGECINCGACEPECPNNAITQAEDIYVIDPLLCTECVGFHGYEACASVCPVDCCVADPNNIETEEVLIARARELHQDISFGENFESRFRKAVETAAPADQPSPQPAQHEEAKAPSSKPPVEPRAEERPTVSASSVPKADSKQPASKVPEVPKAPKAEKRFPGELSGGFKELLPQFEKRGLLTNPLPRLSIFLLQPLLGALPHQVKMDLERAVQSPIFFSAAGATGLNILVNMALYPLILMIAAATLTGVDVLFSQKINTYLLIGLFLGFLEGVYRLRDGLIYVKPPGETMLGAAVYGVPLAQILKPLMARQVGIIRRVPIPFDGFYEKGFVEKLERERRYGNIYTIEDWGNAYFVRLEFPRKVPDIGLPIRSELSEEMPDYDYDLVLKDGHFIVRGRCTDERIRKISSSVGAFPPEFTTVVPLQHRVEGFCHRFENKLLEVLLVKEKKRRD